MNDKIDSYRKGLVDYVEKLKEYQNLLRNARVIPRSTVTATGIVA
jgi:hypothetical protein